MRLQWSLLAIVFIVLLREHADAINLTINRADIERALALMRWPHTAELRARFHDPYLVLIDGRLNAVAVTVQQIEIITEFRRLVLIAEGHSGLNDSFGGRGGLSDAEHALRPWRCLAIDADLQVADARDPMSPTVISVSHLGSRPTHTAHPPVMYAATGLDAAALQAGQRRRGGVRRREGRTNRT